MQNRKTFSIISRVSRKITPTCVAKATLCRPINAVSIRNVRTKLIPGTLGHRRPSVTVVQMHSSGGTSRQLSSTN